MGRQFQPPQIRQGKTKEEALLEPISQTVQSLPQLWRQYQLGRKNQELQGLELDMRKKEFESKYGTGIDTSIQPGKLVSAPPPGSGSEEQLYDFEATMPTMGEESPEQKLKRMGTEGFNAQTSRIKAEMEKPAGSVDAILARRIQDGTMTLEEAIEAKKSLIPQTTVLSPTGAPVATVQGKTTVLPQPNAPMAKAIGEESDAATTADQVVSEMDRLLPLNTESRGGLFGRIAQRAESAMDPDKPSKKFDNTADVMNSLESMVAKMLKSTFGGQLSDGERTYLNKVYGALEGMSRKEREIAIKKVRQTAIDSSKRASNKVSALGGSPAVSTQTAPANTDNDPLGLR